MNQVNILDNLQKIIETAEILLQVLPDEAMDDNWLQETIDNASSELTSTSAYLKDKYSLDIDGFDDEEYLSNIEDYEDFDEEDFDDAIETDEIDSFDFEEEDD